jgi:transposase
VKTIIDEGAEQLTARRRPRVLLVNLQHRSMWSVREWAAMNGISVATAYRWIGKGDLVLSKWRGRSFITREAADAWKTRMASGEAPTMPAAA